MSGIKGTVLLTRFNYIEAHYGKDALKSFFEKLKVDKESPLFQPVQLSKDYPEKILQTMDKEILQGFFRGDLQLFRDLGRWNADHLMPTYFQIYMEEKNPGGFLLQMSLLRSHLIGLGEMHLSELNAKSYLIRIYYGQPYPESVRLSELGFIEKGLELCGAREVRPLVEEKEDNTVAYKIAWK